MAETVAAVFGALYLLVGLVGFVLNPNGGQLLGIFAVNWFHHSFHILVGGLGLAAAGLKLGRVYCAIVGAVFLALALLGFVAPGLAAVVLAYGGAPLLTDNLLHGLSGLGFLYFGLMPGVRPAAPNPAKR